MPSLSEFIFGSKDKLKRKSALNPQQERGLAQYFDQPIEQSPLYGAGSDFLQRLLSGDPEMMSQFEQPYLNQFHQQTVPALAERFAGLGALSSSAFSNSLAQAGSGLSAQLAALRGQMQQQGLGQALGYAQQPYQNLLGGLGVNPYQSYVQQGQQGLLGPLLIGGARAYMGGGF